MTSAIPPVISRYAVALIAGTVAFALIAGLDFFGGPKVHGFHVGSIARFLSTVIVGIPLTGAPFFLLLWLAARSQIRGGWTNIAAGILAALTGWLVLGVQIGHPISPWKDTMTIAAWLVPGAIIGLVFWSLKGLQRQAPLTEVADRHENLNLDQPDLMQSDLPVPSKRKIRQVSFGTVFGTMVVAVMGLSLSDDAWATPGLFIFAGPVGVAIYLLGTPPATWVFENVFELLRTRGMPWRPAAVGAACVTTALISTSLTIWFLSSVPETPNAAYIWAMIMTPVFVSWAFAKSVFVKPEVAGVK